MNILTDILIFGLAYEMVFPKKEESRPIENVKEHQYPIRIKRHRKYTIPDNENRCISTTKTGEQCKCYKKKNSDYCFSHSKKYDYQIKDTKIKNSDYCFSDSKEYEYQTTDIKIKKEQYLLF